MAYSRRVAGCKEDELRISRYIAVLLSTCVMAPAPAADRDVEGLEAGLYVRRDELGVADDARQIDLRADRLGILLSETVNDDLGLGLVLGVAAVDPRGQSVTDGMQLTGNYLGVNLTGAVVGGERWRVGYELGVLYQSVDDTMGDQAVDMDWLESGASLTFSAWISNRLMLHAGPHYRTLDIDQRARGPVTASSSFNEQDSLDTVWGATLETDPGGFVDLHLYHGASDGFMLAFRRSY